MSTIAVTSVLRLPDTITYLWSAMTGADIGAVVELPRFADKCVQIGTLANQTHGGATTVFQGSNDVAALTTPDTAIWFTLKDPLGNSISVVANGMKQVLENPRFVRPLQTGGSAGALDVVLECKK